MPYVALYFKQLGLTPSQAGILVGFRLFAELIGSPLWGIVGDKYKARKIILFVSLLSYCAGNLLLLAFQPHNQKCIETTGKKTVIKPLIFTPEGIELGNEEMGLVTGQGVINDSHAGNLWQPTTFARKVDKAEVAKLFMIYFSITVASSVIGSVVFTMPDALVVGFLQENVNRFGTFRMWGEVGVAFGSFLVGGFIHFSQSEVCGETVKNYPVAFYFCTGFIALAMVNVTFMEVKYQDYESSHNNNILQVVKELLHCRSLIFIVVACHLGILDGLQENFGLWYLDDLGAQPFMLGMAAGFRYCIAFWGYVSSGTIINKVGLVPALATCLLLYVAVFVGMAFAHNPWLGVALFSVQGLLYGLGWSTCAVFGGTLSLKVGFHAAVQGKSKCLSLYVQTFRNMDAVRVKKRESQRFV